MTFEKKLKRLRRKQKTVHPYSFENLFKFLDLNFVIKLKLESKLEILFIEVKFR